MTKVLNQSDAHEILKTDEPASELFRRLICEQTLTGIETIDRHIQLRPGVLLEVCGPHGSGKSELLLQVAVNVLTSGEYGDDGVLTGPSAEPVRKHVVLIDLDGKWDTRRFIAVVETKAREVVQSRPSGGSRSPDAVAASMLARFHLVTCHSSFELLATLEWLKEAPMHFRAPPAPPGTPAGAAPAGAGAGTAARPPRTGAGAAKLALVLLDNVGAFYYQDRSVRGAPARTGHEGSAAAPNAVPSLHGVHNGGCRRAGPTLTLACVSGVAVACTFHPCAAAAGERCDTNAARAETRDRLSLSPRDLKRERASLAAQVQRLMFSLRAPMLASRCANVSLLQGCRLTMKEYLPLAWQVSLFTCPQPMRPSPVEQPATNLPRGRHDTTH
ncbi:MAG: hypothetical protein WDW36_007517 [Sanguina aurantia]